MEIQLHGQYTEQDIRRGLALMRGRASQILGIGVGIVVTLGMLPTVISILSGKAEAIAVLSTIFPALIVLAFFGIIVWKVPRSQARQLREAPLFQGTITGLATDQALELRSEQSEGRTKWGAFVQYKMSDEIVLLYQNNAAAMMVPRGLFASDESWQQFRQYVQAAVPEKAKAQGGILKWRWMILVFLALIVLVGILWGVFEIP
jgi:uncharacterized protein with PQ loop repeat